MPEEISALEKSLSCHICSKTFRDPVTLSCNHNFCLRCLKKLWNEGKDRKCPICEKRSSKDHLEVNSGLKEVADSFAKKLRSKSLVKSSTVCSKHKEDAKLFCEDEKRVFCPICEFSEHQGHRVIPAEKAVPQMKKQLKSDLKILRDNKDTHKRMEKKYCDMSEHLKKQLLSTETRIRAEFKKLHQFLKEEEESRLAALREEEEQKGKTLSREMKRIQEQISALSDSINAVEEELQKDNVAFLSSYKATQSRATAQSSLQDPQLLPGALIDVAKHLGNLTFRVCRRMKDRTRFSPVVLDPNTAGRFLQLTADLTSVRNEDTMQPLPDNPERNTKYTNVFGSEGFSSGIHSWEVEVGGHPRWNIGVVRESVDRKGETSATPEYGIWCLFYGDGKYTDGGSNDITVKTNPQKIRVQLDYSEGKVSFHNSEDMTHIFTHRDTFTEKLFPYFCVGKSDNVKSSLKICKTRGQEI